jgi:hypothetical protein
LKNAENVSVPGLAKNLQKGPVFKVMDGMYVREDHVLYCSLNTLGQKAGVSVDLLVKVVGKELADNALDLRARCTVGLLRDNGIWVQDDGDGIPGTDAEIAELFSIGRPLVSSKLVRRPSRGALGHGLRVIAGSVISSSGSLRVSTRGRSLDLIPQEDGTTIARQLGHWKGRGTRIEVRFGAALAVEHDALEWADQAILLAESQSCYTGQSSVFWYDEDALFELFQATCSCTVREMIQNFRGCGEPKAGILAAPYKGRLANELNRSETDNLLRILRKHSRPVKATALGSVGRLPQLPPGYGKILGEVSIGSARSAVQAELPFVVEAWAQPASAADARLFVNRTPITGEVIVWTEKMTLQVAVGGAYLEVRCGRQNFDVWINIDIPYMPITTDGKEPDLSRFGDHIQRAIAKAIRAAKRSGSSAGGSKQNYKQFVYDNIPSAIEKASGGHQYKFLLRQLLYIVRPLFIEKFGKTINSTYFADIVTDYENEKGKIPGLLRDARGTIVHPHVCMTIPLGTRQVENYERPLWLYRNMLFIEKEGFHEILQDVNWPEKNDCAIMTSKGFSTRAARDLIDLVAATDEECNFYCVHDADAHGTMIYQTLQKATKARGARKVKIHNLGLEPAEARDMGLQVERIPKKNGKKLAVADYVPFEDQMWLQTNRIELNAMPSDQFLDWLDHKFQRYRRKVIPSIDVLEEHLEASVRAQLEQDITAEILSEANFDERVERAFRERADSIAAVRDSLPAEAHRDLARHPTNRWVVSIEQIAHKIATRRMPRRGSRR